MPSLELETQQKVGEQKTIMIEGGEDPELQFFVSWRSGAGTPERGPLHVLWELIASYKVDIFDVSLVRLTEDFLDFLNSRKQLRLDIAASFTHMAARLVYYKSKALLPDADIVDINDEQRLPPELVQQLLEYRKYQSAAEELREIADIAGGMLTRKQIDATSIASDNILEAESHNRYLDLKLGDIVLLYARLLNRAEKERKREEGLALQLERYSVEERISYVKSLVSKTESFSIYEIFENENEILKEELVATFIALLELTRQGILILRQKNNFADIRIFRKKNMLSEANTN